MTPEPAHMAALTGGVPVSGVASTVDALAVALLATGLISVLARRLETAIWLLAGFDQRHKKAGQRSAAPVQQVWKSIFPVRGLESKVHAPRLKILAI